MWDFVNLHKVRKKNIASYVPWSIKSIIIGHLYPYILHRFLSLKSFNKYFLIWFSKEPNAVDIERHYDYFTGVVTKN